MSKTEVDHQIKSESLHLAKTTEPMVTRVVPATLMILTVTVGFLIPVLRTPSFYYWDDTVGAAVGVWQRVGAALIEGRFPFLEVDMWRGGNLIGEAATGMWNPVMAGLMVVTHPFDNLALAMGFSKWVFFLIQAFGVYMLVRGYGVSRWWAALAGATLPIAGWSLFLDGTAWINSTAGAAFLPWAWWGFRRAYLHGFRPGALSIGILTGLLLASTGNPYSLITLVLVGVAVAVEAWFAGQKSSIWWILGMGSVVALIVVIVFLPFLLTSQVGFRANSGIYNDESISPNLSNFLGMSAPVFAPWIRMFGGQPMMSPGVYLAWFVLPLLPWLRWRGHRAQWPSLAGAIAFSAFFFFLALGPSQLWMFRWPGRLIPFLYLGLFIIFVLLLERGLQRDRIPLRVSLSIIAIGLGAWMAFSDRPGIWKWIALAAVSSLILLALAYYWGKSPSRLFVIFTLGLVGFIIMQVMVFPYNANVANYRYIENRSQMQANAEGRYEGLTVQITQYGSQGKVNTSDGIWGDFFPGNMASVINLESTTGYSGIGFSKLDAALGMDYNGVMKPESWAKLWSVQNDDPTLLADLLRAETVVVQRDMFEGDLDAPLGWSVAEQNSYSTIFKRTSALAYPEGRLSYVGNAVTVTEDVGRSTEERASFIATGDGDRSLVFARLAWPGYSAWVNGQPLEVTTTSSGLVSVTIPDDVEAGDLVLEWRPPGFEFGIAGAAAGAVMWIILIFVALREKLRPNFGQKRNSN